MTQDDYVAATDLAKLRIAAMILAGTGWLRSLDPEAITAVRAINDAIARLEDLMAAD